LNEKVLRDAKPNAILLQDESLDTAPDGDKSDKSGNSNIHGKLGNKLESGRRLEYPKEAWKSTGK
jgi:hypothetical protein